MKLGRSRGLLAFLASSAFAVGACTTGSTTNTGADGGLLLEAGADSSEQADAAEVPCVGSGSAVGTVCSQDSQCCTQNCGGSPNKCRSNAVGTECSRDTQCASANCGGSPNTCRENTVGTDCSRDSQCASGNCSGSPNTCHDNTPGTPCAHDSQCASGNCSGSPNVCQ